MATRRKPKKKPAKKKPVKKKTTPSKSAPSKSTPSRSTPHKSARPPERKTALRSRRPQSVSDAGLEKVALPPAEWLQIEGAGDERRRFARARQNLRVRLHAGDEKKSTLEASLDTVDVSLSGLFLRSTFFLPEGVPVRVELETPWGDRTAVVLGHVARTRREGDDAGFAVHFDRLDGESLKDLVCLFAGERVERFVREFVKGYRGDGGAALLWEGILAWELDRLDLQVKG
jgi:hypothetical protein